jgi:hypothetical protein
VGFSASLACRSAALTSRLRWALDRRRRAATVSATSGEGGSSAASRRTGSGREALFPLCRNQPGERGKLRLAGLGQDHAKHTAFAHPFQCRVRIGQGKQREQFCRDPFAAEALQRVGKFGAGIFGHRVKRRAEARLKAVIAQDPQVILGNPLARIADEPHPPRRQIGKPAE